MKKKKIGAALCLAATTSACASIEQFRPDIAAKPFPSRLDEIAYINELRSAYVITERKKPDEDGQSSSMSLPASNTTDASTEAQEDQASNKRKAETAAEKDGEEASSSKSDGGSEGDGGGDKPKWRTADLATIQPLCFEGEGLREFKAQSNEGYRDGVYPEERLEYKPNSRGSEKFKCIQFRNLPAKEEQAKAQLVRYMAAGFGLTDIYCSRFFTVASASQQNRKFGRGVANGVDALVGSVLALSGAGATATGIVNSGFGLVDTTFQNFEESFAVGPELADVERLVGAAQGQFRTIALNTTNQQFPQSYAAARSAIERYASFCSFTGMKQLVNTAVGELTQDYAKQASGSDGNQEQQTTEPPTQNPAADGASGGEAEGADTPQADNETTSMGPETEGMRDAIARQNRYIRRLERELQYYQREAQNTKTPF